MAGTEVNAELTEDISILRNGNFKKLWGAQILSQIAGNLLNFALIIRVFELAQGTRLANVSVALLILSFGIPSIFFAAAAGVYVDHWNKKQVLVISNVVRGLLILGYVFFEHSLIMVLLLTFLISSATQFFAPAEAAAMPALVRKNQLLRANSLFVFTLYASFIVGYSSSAPVIALFGEKGPYIVTFIMFVLATTLVALLPNIHVEEKASMPFKTVIRYTGKEILSNWRLIRSDHNLSFPILQLTLTQAILGVILALAPAMSLAILGVQLKDSSHFFIIPAGIGMVLGVISIDRLTKRFTRTQIIAVGLLIAAAALLLLGLVNRLHGVSGGLARYQIGYFVAPLVFILGYMNALVSVAAQTVLQENTTDSTRGKVFGALGMMINIAATLPVLFAGILADLFGVPVVISVIALGLLLFSGYQYISLHRSHKLA
ncbi:MAG: MFS transporter [Candidatus Saccharimonadales bacterium]